MRLRKACLGLGAVALAALLWVPCLHFFFRAPVADFYTPTGLSPKARALAARHLQLWTDPASRKKELQKMRASNAEWDFMGRSFLVWSLANMGLREPQNRAHYVEIIDRILQETLRLEQHDGMYVFLMPYANGRPYMVQPARSLFIDGELALMMGARRVLAEDAGYKRAMTERLAIIQKGMTNHPLLVLESYPDECWTYDHAVALAAFKLADRLDGTDHSALCKQWITLARQHLIHKPTGLLVSSFSLDGTPLDGPEGSTIWMVCHCLQAVDPEFARDQYQRARKELGRVTLGFGYGVEWPASWQGPRDIDSGAIIPWFEVSAGSSGMAFMAAASFQDWDFLQALNSTLDMAAFPSRKQGALRYCASNQVGDSALLYAAVQGPLWNYILTK